MRTPAFLSKRLLSLGGGLVLALAACTHVPVASIETPEAPPPSILFADVTVFDGESMLAHQDVLIRKDRIAAVGPAGSTPVDPETLRIDGAGRTLLPGLVDAHVHLSSGGGAPWKVELPNPAGYLEAFLYAGVTSVLVAQHGDAEAKVARKAAAGDLLAPHMFLAGPGLTAPGGHPIPLVEALVPWPLDRLATRGVPTAATPDEARAAVDRVARDLHPPLFKLFYDAIPPGSPHLREEVLRAAIQQAKADGMRPIAHVGSSSDMLEAAQDGISLLMHSPCQDLLTDEQVLRLATFQVPFVTTVRAYASSYEAAQGQLTAFEKEMAGPELLAQIHQRPADWNPGWLLEYEKQLPDYTARARANTKKLIDAGVPFFTGTDTGLPGMFPGAALHHELETLVQLGIPPLEVLKSATSRPAQFLDPTGSFGRIAPGMRADLLLVNGDPSQDIQAIDAIEAVFFGGVRLERHSP